MAAREARRRLSLAERRADALKTEEYWLNRKHWRAPGDGRLRRAGREARSGGAGRDGGAGSASGAGAKRRAAMRDTGHGAKKGPVPRRSEGPALAGGRRAALTR